MAKIKYKNLIAHDAKSSYPCRAQMEVCARTPLSKRGRAILGSLAGREVMPMAA